MTRKRYTQEDFTACMESSGLRCRTCGCRHFRVVYTRARAGVIVRRRECRYCGRRITTYERESDDGTTH